jgi:hypothetical protein
MSSVAMNRRIARESGSSNNFSKYNGSEMNNSSNTPITINGNTSQQHYKILTFHENRLNKVFEQVHVLTAQLNKIEPETNLRLHRLEQENASLRKQIASLMAAMNKKENSVSLNIQEDA